MADHTSIEWTDATWNPITGCSVVSPGCTNCYAMQLAGTRLKHHPSRAGLTKDTKAGPVWTGEVRFNEEWLDQPLRWKKPRMIFVCAHGDLFAEGVPDEWIDKVFAVMALAPQHAFQVLTKRAERMREYMRGTGRHHRLTQILEAARTMTAEVKQLPEWPMPNVWMGVSVEDQARAEERIHALLETPAAIRWISAEPLLGPVNLTTIDVSNDGFIDALNIRRWGAEIENWRDTEQDWETSFLDWYNLDEMPDPEWEILPRLDWVVAGGESGPDARPMHPDWARSLRDQCAAAGVPFLFKQWGEWAPGQNVPASVNGQRPSAHFREDRWSIGSTDMSDPEDGWMDEPDVYRIGKKLAGRLLDGVEHNSFPGGRR